VSEERGAPGVKELKRTSSRKPIGFFFPNDGMTMNDNGRTNIVIELSHTKGEGYP